MAEAPKILVVITARGGSKGVPRKNVRLVNGKPLIAYAIEAALEAKDYLYKIIVSTDDEEIAAVSKEFGAEIPFMRPAELASDTAASLPVIQHAAQQIEEQDGITLDWTLLIQPTTPLIRGEDVINIIDLIESSPKATSIISVVNAMDSHPIKLKTIKEGQLHSYIEDAPQSYRRQDLDNNLYKRNGCLYMTRRNTLLEDNDLYGPFITPYIMPEERSLDIDTEFDLKLAEFILQNQ